MRSQAAIKTTQVEKDNLRNLFAQTSTIFCTFSGRDHIFDYVNHAHITALGFDATGKTLRQAQPESVEVFTIMDSVFDTGVAVNYSEISVTLGKGLRYFDVTYAPRRDESGSINGVMVLAAEVTSRVEAVQKIKKANADLERILMQVPAAVAFLKGENLAYEIVNDRYLEIIGKGEVIKGKPVREALPELEESFHHARFNFKGEKRRLFPDRVVAFQPGFHVFRSD